jgi:hypothetical protein
MGFTYQHIMTRYDSKKLSERAGVKEGWYSNAWSVPFVMNRFIDAVAGGWYKINSRYLLQECQDLERRITIAGKTKLEAQRGKHDDRFRAGSLSYITRHHMDVFQERSTRHFDPNMTQPVEINMDYPQFNALPVGDWD